jgi:hypothetical protein
MKRALGYLLVTLLAINLSAPLAHSVVTPGAKCTKAGVKQVYKGKTYTCIKLGKKLYWNNGVVVNPTPTPTPTPSPSPSMESGPATSTRISDLGTQITCSKDGLPVKNKGASTFKDLSYPCEVITPGAFCAPVTKVGIYSGVIYTCKSSATDTRNRWRL